MKCIADLEQIITLKEAHKKDGRNLVPGDLSIINDAAIIYDDEIIHWVGNTNSIPDQYSHISKISKKGHVLTPEVVDSHTHLVFGGNRAFEYSMRLNGADYQDIADNGGGILNTTRNTLKASDEELFDLAVERINRIHSYGIGTIEIKSGYALTFDKEMAVSRLIHKLKGHFRGKVHIHNTYLAAHAIPDGYATSSNYLEKVVIPLLEQLAPEGIIDSVDIFHEQGYFSEVDTKLLFEKAKSLKISTKIHADEFNDNKSALIASEYNALSADHLLCTGMDGINALASSDTVATLLPGTAYFLGKELANAKQFLDAGCKVALASDYNPGSCHCDNLILLASLCAKNMNFNTAQLWSAITLNAAHALGLRDQGALINGLSPRFTLFKCDSYDEITYGWGRNYAVAR